MARSVHAVVEWGVLHPDGHVEDFGTTPSGTVDQFSEGVARYIAGPARSGRKVVSRVKTVTTETTDWVES